jgi:hypothetical protein
MLLVRRDIVWSNRLTYRGPSVALACDLSFLGKDDIFPYSCIRSLQLTRVAVSPAPRKNQVYKMSRKSRQRYLTRYISRTDFTQADLPTIPAVCVIVRDHSRLIQMKFSSWDIDTPLKKKKKKSGVTRSILFMYPCIKTISFMEPVQNGMSSSRTHVVIDITMAGVPILCAGGDLPCLITYKVRDCY